MKDLTNEIREIRKRNHKLKDDSAFVLWFLEAFLVDSDEQAKKSLTGDTSDKNVDAVFIDHTHKQVNIIQGKLRQSPDFNEKRNDILSFVDLGALPWEDKNVLESFYSKLDPLVKQKMEDAIRCARDEKYEQKLFFITTGKVSKGILNEALARASEVTKGKVTITIFDNKETMILFKDYQLSAPAVHTLTLKIVSEGNIQHEGVIHRFDPNRKTESWVFTMSGEDVGKMFAQEGPRLFARNIRGYLGNTDINESMSETIKAEPHNFWFYNNGVTMVCNDAKKVTEGGEDCLIVERGQVINGQQTTRTLSKSDSKNTSVLVKVVKIPRTMVDDEEYDRLVNQIVRATNWQNSISASDLVSNDYIQVFLERELRKTGYQYIRKKMTKAEAKTLFESQVFHQIEKREMAQAVGACLFDPAVVRRGKEGLFEDPYYNQIFNSHSPSFYLSKYWLMKHVQNAARGFPERAYAKWVVLNFAWTLLAKEFDSLNFEKQFRFASEQKLGELSSLHKALDDIFKAALKFYRRKRGTGPKAKDVSVFFMLTNLHTEFQKFWNSNENSYNEKVKTNIDKFKEDLKSLEIQI